MIVVEDRDVSSWRETNFFAIDFARLKLPEKLKEPVENFVNLALKHGLLCPTVKIKENKVTLKYDHNDRYVIFIIRPGYTEYAFGSITYGPKVGIMGDKTEKQLCSFYKYIYNE